MRPTYQIVRTIREDETGLEEIVLTTLMMNLGPHGGLSYRWAGGVTQKVDEQKTQKSPEFPCEHDQRDANIQDDHWCNSCSATFLIYMGLHDVTLNSTC